MGGGGGGGSGGGGDEQISPASEITSTQLCVRLFVVISGKQAHWGTLTSEAVSDRPRFN